MSYGNFSSVWICLDSRVHMTENLDWCRWWNILPKLEALVSIYDVEQALGLNLVQDRILWYQISHDKWGMRSICCLCLLYDDKFCQHRHSCLFFLLMESKTHNIVSLYHSTFSLSKFNLVFIFSFNSSSCLYHS